MLTLAVIEYWSRSFILIYSLVEMSTHVTNAACITPATFKLLIVHWSTRAWFLYVWDLQVFKKWKLGISRCLAAYQDPSTVYSQYQLIFVPWTQTFIFLLSLKCFELMMASWGHRHFVLNMILPGNFHHQIINIINITIIINILIIPYQHQALLRLVVVVPHSIWWYCMIWAAFSVSITPHLLSEWAVMGGLQLTLLYPRG